jgi:hypothetical protein
MELMPEWVVGFVDGEGCFHVSLQKHPEMTVGYQVLPEFIIVQHERDKQLLYALKRFFKSGVVRQNHGDRWALRIRKFDDLRRICTFFQKHPLRTKKNIDFHKFRKIIQIIETQKHLSKEGLLEIIDIALSMNTQQRPSLETIRNKLSEIG